MAKMKIDFVPFEKLLMMTPEQRVSLIVRQVKNNTILITDGKLEFDEEAKLIEATMKQVSRNFPGIEVSSMETGNIRKGQMFNFLRDKVGEIISGKKRGVTIVGPAKLVRKVKKQPDKISLVMK